MLPINTYKKCLCCGNTCSMDDQKQTCECGGYLYIVNQYYQEKTRGKENDPD